uniref:hypothetical protein n=1 Tax=Pseudomonas syringae TaxID=317 RepID=UPI001F1D17DD
RFPADRGQVHSHILDILDILDIPDIPDIPDILDIPADRGQAKRPISRPRHPSPNRRPVPETG